MPIQILPYVQSPLEQLSPYINQFAQSLGQGYQQGSALKNLQALLNGEQSVAPGHAVEGGEGAIQGHSPMNTVAAFQLAEKALGPESAKVLINDMLQSQKLAEKEASVIRKEERQAYAKQQQEFKEKQSHQANIQKTFNVASSLLAKNTPGVGVSPGAATGLSRKAVEGRNAFNTLRGKFESILLPMVNKGTLAKDRFNFILSQIPEASDSQRAIAGKLRGLSETLSEEGFSIDTKILDSIPWASKELKGNLEEQERPPLESFFK